MTPQDQLQNPSTPQLDPDLLNAAYSPTVKKTVRGGDKLTGVKPELLDHWNSLQQEFSSAGITPEIKSGFRTAAQQNALFRNPATRAKTKGNDGYSQISPHQRGEALDISFPAYQRAKGRQIIADYARRTGLHVPSDEPWHVSLGKQKSSLDPDLLSAGYGQETKPQLDPDLLNAAYGKNGETSEPLKTPKVTSEVRDYEPEKLEPIKFQPADNSGLNKLARSVQGLSEQATMQGMELPKTHPNLLGQRVETKFDHQPTQEEVDDALMEQLGKGYGSVAKKFREETGVPLTNNVAIDKQSDGSFIVHARPTQGFIDAVNAYALGGRSAYENTLTSQQMGKAAVARDVQQELKRVQSTAPSGLDLLDPTKVVGGLNSPAVRQDLGQAGAREVGRNTQFMQNVAQLIRGRAPEDDPNARAISSATESIPSQKTNAGALAEIPLSALGAINRAEALGGAPGFPASAAIGSAEKGPEAAYRAGIMTAPILAAGPIAKSIGADEMSPIARQVASRGIAGAGMAAPAIASGASPLEVAKEAAIGGLFPIGARGEAERPTELGIEKAPVSGVQGRGALDAEQTIAERETKVQPTFLRDDQGNPVARVLNPEEVAQGEKPKIRPIHQADTQVRNEKGEFAKPEQVPDVTSSTAPQEVQAGNNAPRESATIEPQTTPPEAASPAATFPETVEQARTEPKATERAVTPKPTEPVVPAEPSTTSARKAQLAQDRSDLELPELPQAERRSWKNALLEAQNEGIDQRANAIADGIIKQPRPLTDKETAGLTLRLQQIKNEHAVAMDAVDSSKGDDLTEARQRAQDLESEFDKLSDAVKQSGTEKGRALASQKLTINQDFDLVSMLNRYKVKTGKEPSPEIRAQIENQSKRITELESQLAKAEESGRARSVSDAVAQMDREARRVRRQTTKKALDDQAAVIKSNIAAEFMRLKTQAGKQTTLSSQGLGLLDPDGVITKELAKYVRNRVQSGVTDAAQIVDDAHALIKEFADGVTRRQIQEAISGYGKPVERRSDLEKQIANLKSQMKTELRQVDVEAGAITAKRQGPPTPPKQGPKETKSQIQRRYQNQINEIERRIREQDFAPKPQRGPTVLDVDTQKIQVNLERAKQDFQRKLREWEYSQRSKPEKIADLAVNWSRAAKLMYVSTLGKLGSAATGRIVMSPIENLVGEIPHRLMPKLSAQATTEGGGFSKAAEVAALWKSGRFRQVLDSLTKGSSDLDVLLGSKKSIDKEMSRGGLLGIPGRVHGAMKELPRQAEFDRAFVKVLKNYERTGRDITRPDVQLAARMEAFNSAERARFQQRNIVSDTFNSAMGTLERQGGLGKALSKAGRFIFPITRVPVNVVGETLNYTFGLPRAVAEHMTRTIRGTMTPEKADNIMRAYKKGGVGLAVMTYAFLHPNQFGGYYQKGDKRDEKEAQPGEIMFFGKRIPKVFTHVPILEAAQFAATARRVMDGIVEKGKDESKLGTAFEGGLASTKGLAEEVPFYETPARWFTGKEGSRGLAEAGGELVRGTIPGFIQEAAKVTDKDKEGQPIPRTPQGGFAERFKQTVEMGVPGLRRHVPLNEAKVSEKRKQGFSDRFMKGQITETDLNRARKNSELTQSEVDSIVNEKDLTDEYNPRQLQFYKTPTLTVNKTSPTLERFERMDQRQRAEVQKIMQEKADAIMDSDSLTETQKKAFAERIKRVGLTVHGEPK